MVERIDALHTWLANFIDEPFTLTSLSGDASFRHYHRLQYGSNNRMVMDAPPDKESLRQFIEVNDILTRLKVRTPIIYARDTELGFALLEDLGDTLFYERVSTRENGDLYLSALEILVAMQQYDAPLPQFDYSMLAQELNLFPTWFLEHYLFKTLSTSERSLIKNTFTFLTNEILDQPYVVTHRDYHSRNIMFYNNELIVIDFQDAVIGPLTYDPVSLLKDCYIELPRTEIVEGLNYFYSRSLIAQQLSFPQFIRKFDLTGLQRHLKVLGIFCRLAIRDNKPAYLQHLPLTLRYILEALNDFPELQDFQQFMQNIKLP